MYRQNAFQHTRSNTHSYQRHHCIEIHHVFHLSCLRSIQQAISIYLILSVIIQNVRLWGICSQHCPYNMFTSVAPQISTISQTLSPSHLELFLYRECYFSFGECLYSHIFQITRSEMELHLCSPLQVADHHSSTVFKELCSFRLFPFPSFMIYLASDSQSSLLQVGISRSTWMIAITSL